MPGCAEAAARCARERRLSAAGRPPSAPNPRFQGVRAVVDNGFNLRKLEEQLAQGRVHARFKQPEPFRRISAALLARALCEPGLDFLLLDLRTADHFAFGHIAQAHCYPAPLLYRAVNEFDARIVAYKNREQDLRRIIVVYDDDERVARPACTLFWEKGVENVFLLTGGLREFAARCPDLIDGTPPRQVASSAQPLRSRSSLSQLARTQRQSTSAQGEGWPSSAASSRYAYTDHDSQPLWR